MIKEAILEEGFGGIGMKKRTQKLTLSAMFLAIGMVLPFFTGQIPKIEICCFQCTFQCFCVGLFVDGSMDWRRE